jgi:3',5'-cyclic AMP phosphodiesterase CpdA
VLLTGDLVDDGSSAGYTALRELLAPLAVPCLPIPGNHDDRGHFRAPFADHAPLPAHGALHFAVDGYPVRVIGLDSTVPGEDHGRIDAAGMQWLAETLAEDRHTPTLLMLHLWDGAQGLVSHVSRIGDGRELHAFD